MISVMGEMTSTSTSTNVSNDAMLARPLTISRVGVAWERI